MKTAPSSLSRSHTQAVHTLRSAWSAINALSLYLIRIGISTILEGHDSLSVQNFCAFRIEGLIRTVHTLHTDLAVIFTVPVNTVIAINVAITIHKVGCVCVIFFFSTVSSVYAVCVIWVVSPNAVFIVVYDISKMHSS